MTCQNCNGKTTIKVVDERGNPYDVRRNANNEMVVTIPRTKASRRQNNGVTVGQDGLFVNDINFDVQEFLFEISPTTIEIKTINPALIWSNGVAVEHLSGCVTNYRVWVELYSFSYTFTPTDPTPTIVLDVMLEKSLNNQAFGTIITNRATSGFAFPGVSGTEVGVLECEDGCCDESNAPTIVPVDYRITATTGTPGILVINRTYGKLFMERIGK